MWQPAVAAYVSANVIVQDDSHSAGPLWIAGQSILLNPWILNMQVLVHRGILVSKQHTAKDNNPTQLFMKQCGIQVIYF